MNGKVDLQIARDHALAVIGLVGSRQPGPHVIDGAPSLSELIDLDALGARFEAGIDQGLALPKVQSRRTPARAPFL